MCIPLSDADGELGEAGLPLMRLSNAQRSEMVCEIGGMVTPRAVWQWPRG